MSSVDQRVVEMRFDRGQFAAGVKSTLADLAALAKGLVMKDGTKGLDNVAAASKRFSLGNLTQQVSSATQGLSAMGVVGVAALATLASKAAVAGAQMAKSLTIAPVMDGLREYETNLNSIQTILANTQASGATLKDVSGALKELNHYSDQTIYNFSEMARNIGTFTAAGVDLDTATNSIKGIANLAALSGSNSQQASTAMYQLSQAISAGKVSLMDWNSVVNAGMGGSVFQRALAETAVAMGKLEAGALKLEGPMKNVKINGEAFRNSISSENGESWLTSDVLTTALANFTGDISDAELAAQGFSEAQIKAIQAQAQTAVEAATVVKTGTQLIGTLQEAAASGWAQTWEIIFGDFEEAKKLWTGVSNVLGKMIGDSADKRNELLGEWKDLGGRDMLIKGIANAFNALLSVLKPVKDAFRAIFPEQTAKGLYDLTVRFAEFTENLKIGGVTAQNLRRTFAGVFAIFSIAGQIISAVVKTIAGLFGSMSEGTGGVLEFTAGIGMFLVSLDKMLKKSGIIQTFFGNIGKLVSIPLGLLADFGRMIGNLFDGFNAGQAGKLTGSLDALSGRLEAIQSVGGRLRAFFSAVGDVIANLGTKIGQAMAGIGDAIAAGFQSANFSKALDVLNTGLLAGIVVLLRNFFSGGLFNIDFGGGGGGLVDSIKDAFDGVTDAMGNMQASIKADTMLKIGAALALITASIVALSFIDGAKLATGLATMAGGLVALQVSVQLLSTSVSVLGALKLPLITASLLALATAMLIFAASIKIMSSMEWDELARGLAGMAGAMTLMVGATILLGKNSGGMVRAGAAMLLLSGAMLAMSVALKIFATMRWDEMARGLAALAGTLGILAAAMKLMPKNMVAQAAALTVLGVALNIMAVALKIFATMELGEIGRALAVLAGSLGLIAAAMHLMPKNMVAQSLALVAVATALNVLGAALLIMATMSWDEIGRGLATLAGSLIILAGGLHAMNGTLAGSAALLVAAGALAVFAPVLATLGNLDVSTIVTGLGAIAGIFIVLGAAGYILAPVVPVILGLAAALVLIGAGFALAGVGAAAFAAAFGIVVAAGAAGVVVLNAVLKTFIDALPGAMAAFGKGIVEFGKVIAKAAPEFFRTFSEILKAIIDSIVKNTPVIVAAFFRIITSFLKGVTENAPKLIRQFSDMLLALMKAVQDNAPKLITGFTNMLLSILKSIQTNAPRIVRGITDMLVAILNEMAKSLPRIVTAGVNIIVSFLRGIAQNIPRVITAAVDIIVAFIRGISQNLSRIIQAGVDLILAFIRGLSQAIRNNSAAVGEAGADLGVAIVQGMARGIAGGLSVVVDAAKRLASGALDAAKRRLGIASPSKEFEKIGEYVVEGFAEGITGNSDKMSDATDKLQELLEDTMKSAREDVIKLTEKLKDLRSEREQDVDAIKETRDALFEARRELALSRDAHGALTITLMDERLELQNLANRYDILKDKLKEAEGVLESAKKTRDDYNKQLVSSYGDLPSVDKDTQLGDYLESLRKKVADTNEFSVAIQKLRDLGLNDESYKDLLARGIDALPFVNQLLEGGKSAVDEVNLIGQNLMDASIKLGADASRSLYEAGVQSAQGLVDGLKSQESELVRQMEHLADVILGAMKGRLGIKSPSREFAKLGAYSIEGMAEGLRNTSAITAASEAAGKAAINGLRSSLTGLSSALGSDIDLNPVITPVMDLSTIQRDAARLGAIVAAEKLTVGSAYSAATSASAGYRNNLAVQDDISTASPMGSGFVFNQYNSSPKALSSSELYRQTKNQLSTVKGVRPRAGSS